MKVLDRLLGRGEYQNPLKGLHPDFRILSDDYITNRIWEIGEGPMVAKVGFKFDDVRMLDRCPFIAKFGLNFSEGEKYFGLAYAHKGEEDALIEWSQRFPYVRYMTPLTRTGELTGTSQTTAIKG